MTRHPKIKKKRSYSGYGMNSVTKMKITAHFFTFRYVFFLFVVCRPNLDLKLYRIVNILVDTTNFFKIFRAFRDANMHRGRGLSALVFSL